MPPEGSAETEGSSEEISPAEEKGPTETDEPLLSQLSDTRQQIIRLLRKEDRTVRELADHLGLTRNAVRAQLSKLKDAGITEITGRRPTRRKPEHVYGLTQRADQLFHKSYDALLNALLSTLAEENEADVDTILQQTGRRLAQAHKPAELEPDIEARVGRARRVLEEMGGLPEATKVGDQVRVEGTSCPLAAAVRAHGTKVCDLARALIEELTELTVERRCSADGKCPQCKFVVSAVSE